MLPNSADKCEKQHIHNIWYELTTNYDLMDCLGL
jgi:hypothetical protein